MSYPNHIAVLAIAGGDSLVGHALELMLQSAGYDARFLDEAPLNGPSDPLEGVSLVLLAPRASESERKVLLSHLHSSDTPEKGAVPMLQLVTITDGEQRHEEEEVRRVLWPCSLKDLTSELEAALHSRAPLTKAS